ncbi:tail fiber domain-containing protein [Lachnospiraceae bacterium]|nr:tail fiber domain-containing protein [Lachnospiraceae bacterium]
MQPFFHPGTSPEVPTLVLQLKSGESLGVLDGVTNLIYKKNLNSANELSFTVCKYLDGNQNPLWNFLTDLKNIYVPEFQERFEIKVSCHEETTETKSVTAISLCEAELGQIILRGLEINTDQDLTNNSSDTYPVTVFCMDISDADSPDVKKQKEKHSLLHRVLSGKASFYRIGKVDEKLKNLAYTFSADEISVYDFLTGEVAKQMQCLFEFDSMSRKIHVHALSEDDSDEDYGKDTVILIDRENLASSLTCEGDADSLKNCFYVEGGDELINAAFAQINTSGDQYLYYFSPETLADMPEYLREAIAAYHSKSENYLTLNPKTPAATTHPYQKRPDTGQLCMFPAVFSASAADTRYTRAFQEAFREISRLTDQNGQYPYEHYSYTIPDTYNRHSDLVRDYYNAIDFQSFLEYKMMPDYKMEVYDKYRALSLLNAAALGTIGIAGLNLSNPLQSSIKNAIKNKAKTLVNTALFAVDIDDSQIRVTESSLGTTVTWTGTFSITDRQNEDPATSIITNTTYRTIAEKEHYNLSTLPQIPVSITLTINDDIVTYSKNSIASMLAKKDLPMAASLYSPDVSETEFQSCIKLYGLESLNTIERVLTDCLGILSEQLEKMPDASSRQNALYKKLADYQQLYIRKLNDTAQMISKREQQIKAAELFALLMETYLDEVKDALDFQKHLNSWGSSHNLTQNLWETFQCYRREGAYRNDNIISTGLKDNAEIIKHAQTLMDFAKKELETAGTLQYSISTTMDNLLALPEFAPFFEDFDVGNWIRVRMDVQDEFGKEQIYKLRLLSYQINYETADSSGIQVEFSTVTRNASGVLSDVESILNSAQSMAKSYSATVRQASLATQTAKTIDGWVSEGLSLTNQQIINDAKEQSLVIDSSGLLARKQDPLTDTYDDCQLRIYNNGLYTTCNNWKTIDAALGKFWYKDINNNGQLTETYGIIAKKVIGEQILGENFQISNRSGSMKFTDKGLTITNGVNTITFHSNVSDSSETCGRLLQITSQENTDAGIVTKDLLYTDTEGNLNINGKITATTGTIGGFDINQTYFSNGTNALGTQEDSVYIGTDGISCGTGFTAYHTGECRIQGGITAKGEFTLIGGSWIYDPRPLVPPVFIPDTVSVSIIAGDKLYTTKDLGISGRVSGLVIENNLMANAFYTINDGKVNSYLDKTGLYLNHGPLKSFQPILSFCDDGSCDIGRPDGVLATDIPVTINAHLNNVTVDSSLSVKSNIIQNAGSENHSIYHILRYSYNSSIYNGKLQVFPSQNGAFRVGLFDETKNLWNSCFAFSPNKTFSLKCRGEDDSLHDVINTSSDGLTLSLGLNLTDYTTNTILRGSAVHLKNASGEIVTSDERLKNSFKTMEQYETFFDSLKPYVFKLNNGTSGRYHSGFKAQQVLKALEENNLTSREFAGYVKYAVSKDSPDYQGYEEEYGLIYAEFVALNTHMIQKTRRQLQEANHAITKLQEEIADLKAAIQKLQEVN